MKSSDSPKTAVITGGGTGIGLACAKTFASAGYEVTSLGLDADGEGGTKDQETRRFDVTDADTVAAFGAGLRRLDVLVNAAGMMVPNGGEMTDEGFRRVMEVNLLGTQMMCYACREALEVAGGSVVNFASMWSFFGSPGNPGYSASKGAVVALTRSLAAGWGPRGVRVNAVAPGWIETRMSSGAIKDHVRADSIMARIPMRRWGVAEEVSSVVLFLSSFDARYINGVVLPVDGGYAVS